MRIFRVDNPHTKPFAFWEWLIGEVKEAHPDVIFLAEAFTRPKIMYHLAKLGFTQSYTYFAWRNTKQELTEYFTELTQTGLRDFFRPNAWPNTPDILTDYVASGGRAARIARLVLAATLSASYGIYGPGYELLDGARRDRESEEYRNSEKYEIKYWDLERRDSLRDLIARLNRARRENAALQSDGGLRFHWIDNDQLICYSKQTEGEPPDNVIITIVNLDTRNKQSGWVHLPAGDWGLGPEQSFEVQDLLTDSVHRWRGLRNYVELNPQGVPAHVLLLRHARRRV